ncbi:MAG: hypothetical protein AABY22_08365 [Nanoarchaeota archaeon]
MQRLFFLRNHLGENGAYKAICGWYNELGEILTECIIAFGLWCSVRA